ncbi:MAG: DNA polymerase I [Elusimicrobiota bacterium]|nr:DNA polymerase I [Elusimicrobiota bacterium]
MTDRKKLFIVDGNNYIHRAFHALPPFSSPRGEPVGALFGFSRMLLGILKKHKPERMAVVFDSPGKNFRHSEYSEYKANRPPPDETLVFQMKNMRGVTEGLGIASISAPGYEADDLTASMAGKFKDDYDIYIVSADKDLCQLVGDNVRILNEQKKIITDAAGVAEKYGVTPGQFCDWQALVGDKSDNIPGAAGIGPKGATALISEYGNIESVYEKIDSVKESLRKKLVASRENVFLSKKLVTLLKDLPVPLDDEDMKTEIRPGDVVKLSEKWGFASLKKEYGGADTESVPREISRFVFTEDLSFFKKCGTVAISFAEGKKLNGIAFAGGGKTGFADTMQTELDFGAGQSYKKEIEAIFSNPGIKIVTDDSKRILGYCLRENIAVKNEICDLSLMGYVIDSMPRQDVVRLASKFLGVDIPETGKKEDFAVGAGLMFKLEKTLSEKTDKMGLMPIYRDMEKPLAKVLAHMEFHGVKLDSATLETFSVFLEKDIERIRREILELAGEEFNVNSNVELRRILFEKLGLTSKKKVKTGASVDAEVLRDLASENPICGKLLKYRHLAKMKSTYADALPALAGPDGRIHTTFNSTGTLTGRLSSARPNMQNIPARGEMAGEIRRAFVCDEGKAFLSGDYSQIDLRVLAHFSGDDRLIEAFTEDEDIHNFTASLVFGTPIDDVSREQRRIAKTVNFGIVYGMSSFGLAADLEISRKEAAGIIEEYWKIFPGVKEYVKNSAEAAFGRGYTETLFGRRRILYGKTPFDRRAAINTPIQGTSSDIIKKAMIDIYHHLDEYGAVMILQVHDELLFEIDESNAEKFAKISCGLMENAVKLTVPLKVNMKKGLNFAEMKGLKRG